MREVTGEEPVLWGPSIVGYGSYHYVSPTDPRRQGDWPKVGFSPRRAALTLYGLKDLPEGAALLTELGAYTEGAGCVYVKRLEEIDEDVLRRLIAIAASRSDDPPPRQYPPGTSVPSSASVVGRQAGEPLELLCRLCVGRLPGPVDQPERRDRLGRAVVLHDVDEVGHRLRTVGKLGPDPVGAGQLQRLHVEDDVVRLGGRLAVGQRGVDVVHVA